MTSKICKILFGSALVAAAGVSSASDAVLTSVSGTALLNQGDAFVTPEPQAQLHAGDRLMVMEGGSAEVTYADGCTHTVVDSEVLTIGKQSTCAGEQAAAEDTGPNTAALGGGGAGAWLVGAVGVGTAGLAITVDNNGKGGISP